MGVAPLGDLYHPTHALLLGASGFPNFSIAPQVTQAVHEHTIIMSYCVPTLPDRKNMWKELKEYAVLSSSTSKHICCHCLWVSMMIHQSESTASYVPPTCSLTAYANTRIANYCTHKIPACADTTFSTRIANYCTLAVQHVTTPLPQQLFLTFIPVVPQACDNAT